MLRRDFLERLTELYDIDDILYILGKDRLWLMYQLEEDIMEHKEDFFQGDDYYAEVTDD